MSYKVWTPKEDAAIAADWEAGLTTIQIARKHGWSKGQLHGRQYRLGLSPRLSPVSPEAQAKRAVKMDFDAVHKQRRSGATWREIVKHVKWCDTAVRNWYYVECAKRGVEPVVVDSRFQPRVQSMPKPIRVKAVRVAPQKPAQALPALALVRGAPGVAQPPVSFPWPRVKEIAAGEAWNLKGFDDLPAYNRSRITRGYAPLAIRRAA